MKAQILNKILKLSIVVGFIAGINMIGIGCGKESAMVLSSTSDGANLGSVFEGPNSGAGGGSKVSGLGSFSVPTADALVARIEIGLQGNVKSSAGNFRTSLLQVKPNLPKVTDPTLATGFDNIQLLVYGACSDLTTGGTPLMLSKYNVDPNKTIANNQAALVSAGIQMLDQYVAGLASGSTAAAQINTALTDLVTQIIATPANTSKIAFMSVCIAANTSGSSLMGF